MRILLHALNFAPELAGAGKYTAELARALVARDCHVRVVTTPPYYPAWNIGKGYSAWRYSREVIDGIEVVRCPLWVPGRVSGLKRVLHLLSFAFSSFPAVLHESLAWNPDAVISVAPTIFAAPAALLAARLSQAASLLHVQDFEIEAAFKLGLLRHPALRRAALLVEESLLHRFDRVTTISQRMLERLWQKGVGEERAGLFLNGVNLCDIRPLAVRDDWRQRHNLPQDAFVVLYAGSIGEKQGLDLLIAAARTWSAESRLLLVIAGEGSARERLIQQAAGCERIRFLPLQPAEDLNSMLNAADLHVLPQVAEAEDLVMPSKLGPILASGGAVVATARPGTELAHAVGGADGMVIPPGSAEELSSAIRKLSASPEYLRKARLAARRYAERHLDIGRIHDDYVEFIRDAVSAKKQSGAHKEYAVAHVQI